MIMHCNIWLLLLATTAALVSSFKAKAPSEPNKIEDLGKLCMQNLIKIGNPDFADFPYPNDCGNFLSCGHNGTTAVVQDCGPKRFWNDQKKWCDWISEIPINLPCFTADVCWKGTRGSYGVFYAQTYGYLSSIKLEHVSGGISCIDDQFYEAYWGCTLSPFEGKLATIITDDKNQLLFPRIEHMDAYGFFEMDGFDEFSSTIEFKRAMLKKDVFISTGQELRVWYAEDWLDHADDDNIGQHCAQISMNTVKPVFSH